MNTLQVFENPEFGSIRTVEIGGEPWLVGKDVARALGYKNPRQALSTNVDEEDRGVHSVDTPSGTQDMTIINESGLYSLILSSKLPKAKNFKRWVTSEVLPALRRTGTYTTASATVLTVEQRPLTTDDYIRAAAIVAGCPNVRLPYVLSFLEQGGFQVAQIEPPRKKEPFIKRVCFEILDLNDFL